jgi:hypothetical protein
VIVTILLGAWATGPVASLALIAAQVSFVVYVEVYAYITGISIWLGTCAVCPALYFIKLVCLVGINTYNMYLQCENDYKL